MVDGTKDGEGRERSQDVLTYRRHRLIFAAECAWRCEWAGREDGRGVRGARRWRAKAVGSGWVLRPEAALGHRGSAEVGWVGGVNAEVGSTEVAERSRGVQILMSSNLGLSKTSNLIRDQRFIGGFNDASVKRYDEETHCVQAPRRRRVLLRWATCVYSEVGLNDVGAPSATLGYVGLRSYDSFYWTKSQFQRVRTRAPSIRLNSLRPIGTGVAFEPTVCKVQLALGGKRRTNQLSKRELNLNYKSTKMERVCGNDEGQERLCCRRKTASESTGSRVYGVAARDERRREIVVVGSKSVGVGKKFGDLGDVGLWARRGARRVGASSGNPKGLFEFAEVASFVSRLPAGDELASGIDMHSLRSGPGYT
ncbi:hypothetical protein C8F04DRAFT_1193150 [Mycena alexandri]|uniref:Uncharacterized protein n=1 Tax=Mycena alexandri TaxID=1745969 RepID=A0AAD6WSW9_9AGAR|nr:hypothetical protein C8F04DRAFT_1193150 [Mycena alexandri]